ncbi:sensor histidine kinase [Microbacterium yannicii]|uniref:sensor histidine kinase n=1 Tax=Microbacterium yannicii TaxID=671622 RepID=UPI000305E985|nr:sensor histidine kinase [Microbacterium yannicii]
MQNRRWWDAAVIAASLMVVVTLTVGPSGESATAAAVAWASLGLFVLGYIFVARRALTSPRLWRLPVFVAASAVALAGGCAGEPFFAILQAIAYPLTWVLAVDRRRAIGGSVVIALGTFTGFALFSGILAGGDAVLPALAVAAAVAGFGLAFAIAFGLWMAGVVEYGQERARLLGELTAAQAEVESLSRDRGAAVERERLARDVHDTLAQTLAGLAILSERAGRQLDEGRADAAADSIATVERLSRDALDEARAIVSRMAAVPSDTALGDAVDRLVSRFRAETGLTIDLDLQLDSAGVLPRESQLVLLRCLQESLANVRKHAAATRVDVRVSAGHDGEAQLTIADDGRGFDVAGRNDGFGLDGMAERVALAGGVFDLASTPGRGTTLLVRLPPTRAGHGVAR